MSMGEELTDTKKEIEAGDLEEQNKGEHEDIKKIEPWTKQITLRAIVSSVVIGSVYSIIAMKLNLTTGLVPNLNISAALLAFVFMRSWTKVLHRAGIATAPFTRQENTIIQTCSVACYSIAVGGGFGSYLLGLSKKEYELAGTGTVGNTPESYKEPGIGWMTGYLFLVCFVGLFVLIPLRKVMIIDYNLIYPSGTATSVLINGFHSMGDHMAMKQVKGFMKYFTASFFWGFFQWFFSGKVKCGFSQFPTFGLQAWRQTFYFDFSMTFVGTGMICPHLVNLSLLLGSILSWGIMWPLISNREGKWFPENLPESSMEGLNGYKTFFSIALILGDGLYNFMKVMCMVAINVHDRLSNKNITAAGSQHKALEDLKKNEVFNRDSIPTRVGVLGYILFSMISVIALPNIFHQLKWYYVVVAYILAPSLAFCNAYGAGLTDMNMSYNYGKVALFVLAALAGKNSGVVAGLAGCGLIKSVVSVACILMQDLKTSHLTYTSPRSMFISQAIGTALGCVVAPLSFFLFYKAFDVGNPMGEFKVPFAIIYRNMAILGVEGFSALPQHCLEICCGFFAFAVGINLVRDRFPNRVGKWMPIPMAMAAPFLVGTYFTIDMCLGTLVVFVWQKMNAKKAELMVPAVASGLICGEGLWILPSSILALAKLTPPICMKFLAS
ncbi:metal-nicotianamine transporter YSL3-like [Malania oleifera]|uniref:metal-nicotianamine transporter YSL3-like n=1 Tax=Malania oleifera TaxID=397392 RepID=UPI0025ADCC48|nr:metal-nicotianamine transporter YSL3-like [Malania oleifera]